MLKANQKAKVTEVKLAQFWGEQIVWVYYEDGTYLAVFVD